MKMLLLALFAFPVMAGAPRTEWTEDEVRGLVRQLQAQSASDLLEAREEITNLQKRLFVMYARCHA